jgi:hypothetical protein
MPKSYSTHLPSRGERSSSAGRAVSGHGRSGGRIGEGQSRQPCWIPRRDPKSEVGGGSEWRSTVNAGYRSEGRNERPQTMQRQTSVVASDRARTGRSLIDSSGGETENREDKRKPKEQKVVTGRKSRVVKRRPEMRPEWSSRLVPPMGRICSRKWKELMRQQQRPVVCSVSRPNQASAG